MARIRNLHPEQWVDEEFISCSMPARLLALSLRNFADDNGVIRWSPLKIKMLCFPGDNIDIEPLLTELEETNQIRRYVVGDREYAIIRNLRTYNRPRRPFAEHPLPPDLADNPDYLTPKVRRATDNGSHPADTLDNQAADNVRQAADTRGQQGRKVRPDTESDMDPESESDTDQDLSVDRNAPPAVDNSPSGDKSGKKNSYSPEFDAAWEARPRREGSDDKRKAWQAWRARLKEGHMPDEMLAGWLRYKAYLDAAGKANTSYVLQAATFLGPADPPYFDNDWTLPAVRANGENDSIKSLGEGDLMQLASRYQVATRGKSTEELKTDLRRAINAERESLPTVDLRG